MDLINVVAVVTLLSGGCLSQVITTSPQDTTVNETGDATFTCLANEGASPSTIGWRFTPSGSTVGITLDTGTNLTGIEMVTVSEGLRNMLTFSRVRREANNGTLVCLAFGTVTDMSDPATFTVQWRYTVTPSSDVIILDEGGSDEVLYTVVEGNPPSNLVVSGPLQPGNGRVNFTSTGVYMNQVNMGDNGIHTATWSNAAGMTEFTLTLLVNVSPCDTTCIVIIVVVLTVVFLAGVAAGFITAYLLWRHWKKRNNKGSARDGGKGNEESLTKANTIM